jgi:NAD(P)-dependent dehydrogenase (short-subunit alcohol dehydrogenase family)
MSTQAHKANIGLDLTGKTAVIAGGSQGIGASVAIRFAQAGANVVIIGRSQERLSAITAEARKLAKSQDQKIDSISADLSLVSSIKSLAKDIEAKTDSKVDYLVQTQGGTPNGRYETTSEGFESHFAVQILSRFLLNYVLSSSGVLKDASISVMAPGGTQTEFNLDDIELSAGKDSNRLAQMASHVSRDGLIADTYTKALQRKFPSITYFHIYPGLVQTEVMTNQGMPFPIGPLINYIVYPIAARTFGNTATSYADIPVFLAANNSRDALVDKEGLFLDNKSQKAALSPYALDEANQEKVFEKLKGYLNK